MVARVYALDGTYAGRVMWIDEFMANGLVSVCLKDMGGDSMIVIPMEMIEISTD